MTSGAADPGRGGTGAGPGPAAGRAPGAGAAGRPERVPAAPPAARSCFGAELGRAEAYAGLLAGPGLARGLIGPREVPRLWTRHILDSAAIAGLVPRPAALIDLGSGAGLPGIVLAVLLPDVEVTLLERMGRRAGFLDDCVRVLALQNAHVVQAQAEEMSGRVSADVVTARAVAPLAKLAPLALRLVRPGGVVLAMKGAGAQRELALAEPELARLRVREAEVISAGGGKVGQAATVVRLIAGP